MATNTNTRGASMLAAYARAQAGPGNSLKNFSINTNALDVVKARASQVEQELRRQDAELGGMPDLSKINANTAPILQDFFMKQKEEMYNISQELNDTKDPIYRQELLMKKAQYENSAKMANQYLNDRVDLAKEYDENFNNISKTMDENKLKKIGGVLKGQAGTDFTIEFNDSSGKPTYVLSDGTKVEHDELDDWSIKNFKAASSINEQAKKVMNSGLQGGEFTDGNKTLFRTDLMNSITSEDALNSLVADGLIDGLNFEEAMKNLKPNANFEEKRDAVIGEIIKHYEGLHNQGKEVYLKKQFKSDGDTIIKPVDGSIPFFSTRNQGDFIWYEEHKGYGPAIPDPNIPGAVTKIENISKDRIISDPDALNTMTVGFGNIKFGK